MDLFSAGALEGRFAVTFFDNVILVRSSVVDDEFGTLCGQAEKAWLGEAGWITIGEI